MELNSVTIKGRANVAKLTIGGMVAIGLMYKMKSGGKASENPLVRTAHCQVQPLLRRAFSSLPHTSLGTGTIAKFDPTCQLHLISCSRHREHGPLYVEQLAPGVNLLFVGDPQLCKQVLRKDGLYPMNVHPLSWTEYGNRYGVERGLFFKNGPAWADWRRRMQPILLKAQKSTAADFAEGITENLVYKWETGLLIDEPNEVPCLSKALKQWAVEVNLAALFGNEYNNLDVDVPALVSSVNEVMVASSELQILSATHEADKDTALWQRFKTSMDYSLQTMEDLTLKHAHNCTNGLLPKLMSPSQGNFSPENLGRIVADLVIAAADTTAISAEWTLHLLATHKEEQAKLLADPSGRHLNWCIKESMRLYPVAPFLTRILQNQVELNGYIIPAGTMTMLSTYAMGRSEELFANPDAFWPERWQRSPASQEKSAQDKVRRTPFATLPFGFGARSCIGKRLAEEQLCSLIQLLVHRFELTSMNNESVSMTMRMTGKPDQDVRISLAMREK